MNESKIVVIDGLLYAQTRLFMFNDLEETAKLNAINNRIRIIVDYSLGDYSKYKGLEKAFKACETLKTPWFIYQYVFEYCGDEIKEELQNDFLFTANGAIYSNYELATMDINKKES